MRHLAVKAASLTGVRHRGIMVLVISTNGAPLGFSITSALKTAAKTAYHTAQDPRAQALVAAAGQAYAPGTTSQVMQVTHKVQGQIRRARQIMNPGGGQAPAPAPAPDAGPPPDDAGPPDAGPPLKPQHGMLLVGGAIGAVLLVLLLTK